MLQNNLKTFGAAFVRLSSNVPFRSITMKTTQATIIEQRTPLPEFTRQNLKILNESPTAEEQRIIDAERKKQDDIRRTYENKFNDRNPANHLKVKINLLDKYKVNDSSNLPISSQQDEATQNLLKPHILLIKPRPKERLTVTGIRRKVQVSMKKLFPLMRSVIGMHIYDAQNLCSNNPTKAAKFVLKTLTQVLRNGIHNELNEERLYVSAAMTGRQKRVKRIRYHAKARSSFMIRDTSQLIITLEEKPIEDMYKEMIQGKTPPALAFILRKKLLESGTDYEVLRRNSYILTAKGRQQRRLMFKRKVQQQQLAFKGKGLLIMKNMIERKILEEEARVFASHYRDMKQKESTTSLTNRQALFKKNEEAVGL